MSAPSRLVHAHVYNPATPSLFIKGKKTDPAEYHTVSCSESARCELFARGQCAARTFMGAGCLYGRASTERGPTQRAKTFYEWVRDHKAEAEKIGSLAAPVERLARIADMIWLPYSFMDVVLTNDQHSRQKFVPVADFTAALIVRLCAARPMSLFGGEITDYQRKSVPLFVAHLSETYPDLLREAAPLSPRIQAILPTLTKVGRKAKLHTLRPSIGTFEGWTWDGTHMISADRRTFPPFTKFSATEMRITPAQNAVVTITDDAQVTPETVFED